MTTDEDLRRRALALPERVGADLLAMCNARRVDTAGIRALRELGLIRHGRLLTDEARRMVDVIDADRRAGGPLAERLGTGPHPEFGR